MQQAAELECRITEEGRLWVEAGAAPVLAEVLYGGGAASAVVAMFCVSFLCALPHSQEHNDLC
jgi:hypothetical protein